MHRADGGAGAIAQLDRPMSSWRAGNDQYLKVWAMRICTRESRMQCGLTHTLAILMQLPVARVLAKRSRDKSTGYASGKGCGRVRVAGCSRVA